MQMAIDHQFEQTPAWIVTFFAYKGGTGRTLALANVARYLAEDRGYRVGVIDLDLDSPGLANQELLHDHTSEPNAKSEISERNTRNSINQAAGFIGLYLGQCSLKEAVVQDELNANGRIVLMPAGPQSLAKDEEYKDLVEKFNQQIASDLSNAQEKAGQIVDDFIEGYCLDFVLIDSRTGTGQIFPVTAKFLPQALVLFVGLNDQNVDGSLSILRERFPAADVGLPARPTLLVASPIPSSGLKETQDRLKKIRKYLEDLKEKRHKVNLGKDFLFQLPPTEDIVQLPYTDLAVFRERYFIREFPDSAISRAYVDLARRLEGMVISRGGPKGRASQSAGKVAVANGSNKVIIALEDVSLHVLKTVLGKYYQHKEELEGKCRLFDLHTNIVDESEIELLPQEIELRSWEATDRKSPWEKLANPDDSNFNIAGLLNEYDIICVPHSDGGFLAKHYKGWLWVMEDLEPLMQGDRMAALDFAYLRKTFPNLDRWTQFRIDNGSSYLGLPFSASTQALLIRPPSREEADEYMGFPSNWQLVYRQSGSVGNPSLQFEFATKGRALYYEWLNVVVAFGGRDFRPVSGHSIGLNDFDDERTIEGTLAFLDLWRRNDMKLPTDPDKDTNTMVGNIRGWATNPSATRRCGFAWLDLFKFAAGDSQGLEVRFHDDDNSPIPGVLLGRIPRDMRYARRPVVAGWLMVFPRREPVTDQQMLPFAALKLASYLLGEQVQHDMLRAGFPTPSVEIVRSELAGFQKELAETKPLNEASPQQRAAEQFYHNFLLALSDGLTAGHWVPAFEKSRERIDAIRKTLTDLIRSGVSSETPGAYKRVKEDFDRMTSNWDQKA
jgi:CobQ/CobB/MinD/ParA nucleotide binding domain